LARVRAVVGRAAVFVVSVEEMRAAEAAAFAAGSSEARLQAAAGAAVAAHARHLRPEGPVVVLAGVGNNGRDAWVAACDLARDGRPVALYLMPRHAIADEERRALGAVGGRTLLHDGAESLSTLRVWLREATLAIDGLLGIGARGAPRPPLSEVAALLNTVRAERRGGLLVLAIDVPSGIDADGGAAEGDCVQADATVVLGALKRGLLRFPAAERAGALLPGDIGLPQDALTGLAVRTLDRPGVLPEVPPRSPSGHKGTFGRVVVAGGSPEYYGAPYLAGAAALRSGCGLLAFAAAPALQAVLAGLLPEATYLVLPHGAPVEAASEAAEAVVGALGDAQALLIGPGLGRSAGAREFVGRLLRGRAQAHPEAPVVVDADALYVLATEPALLGELGPGSILTPHHGEMARLVGQPAAAIAASPWEIAVGAARRWGTVVVLKGPFTVVAVPQGQAWIWPHANPALATGGTGDVLAGAIAGLLAQGLAPAAAARVGVYAHAVAALRFPERTGADLLLASDLPVEIARELGRLRAERGDIRPVEPGAVLYGVTRQTW
jgi:NAD(P)H-hydrate epimerase